MKEVELKVDSLSVYAWISSVLTGDNRVRSKGLSEALVCWRLTLLKDALDEYGVALTVTRVPSHKNCADVLTKVPKAWLHDPVSFVAAACE